MSSVPDTCLPLDALVLVTGHSHVSEKKKQSECHTAIMDLSLIKRQLEHHAARITLRVDEGPRNCQVSNSFCLFTCDTIRIIRKSMQMASNPH